MSASLRATYDFGRARTCARSSLRQSWTAPGQSRPMCASRASGLEALASNCRAMFDRTALSSGSRPKRYGRTALSEKTLFDTGIESDRGMPE